MKIKITHNATTLLEILMYIYLYLEHTYDSTEHTLSCGYFSKIIK